MKKQSLRIFLMLGLFAILAVSNAQAQTINHEQTANIPFSFTIGGKDFRGWLLQSRARQPEHRPFGAPD